MSWQETSGSAATLPRRFGSYTLLRSVSRGGMGQVYLARSGALAGAKRLCILKTIRPDIASDDEYVRRFIEEARIAVTLNHAGVCHVFDAGKVGASLYLAMEHIAGVNLRGLQDALAARGKGLPPSHALFIAVELLEALDYAHHHSHPETGEPLFIVHRDVSPQNVMVSFEGEVKLIDFGLAKSTANAVVTDNHVMGKLLYMSPEQARGGTLDGATDQFSAAIVAYELLTGQRFWGHRARDEVYAVIGVGGFLPDGLDTIAPEIQRVLIRAFQAEAKDRYATCGEMANELRMILARHHPMMSRTALRTFLSEVLGDMIEEHRAQMRSLPSTSAVEREHASEPAEPTQSFTAMGGAPLSAMATMATTVINFDPLPATESAESEPIEPTTLTPHGLQRLTGERRAPRALVAALAAIAVCATAAFVVTIVKRDHVKADDVQVTALPDAQAADVPPPPDKPPPDKPPADKPPPDKPLPDKPDVLATPVEPPIEAPDIAPPIEPVEPVARPAKRTTRKSPPRATTTAAPPSPPRRDPMPGSIETKRKTVMLVCNGKSTCQSIQTQISEGKFVLEATLEQCIRDCR